MTPLGLRVRECHAVTLLVDQVWLRQLDYASSCWSCVMNALL